MLSADGDGTQAVVDLAARLGLESTGIAVPIAKPPKSITAPDGEPILVLAGVTHPLVDELIKNDKWVRPSLQPGEGLIQVVKKAFGEKSAIIVTGGDAAGVDRAIRQLAETFPHIWSRGKDRHDARRCRRRVAPVRGRAIAGRSGGDELHTDRQARARSCRARISRARA